MRSARTALGCLLALWLGNTAGAFERTEERQPCAHHNPLRNPYFGDLHVHTSLSFDAAALGVRATPRDAYRFARGEPLRVRPYDQQGQGLRQARLRRPLDFAAVTDHAELLGETHICQTPGAPGYDSLICSVYRRWPLLAYIMVNSRMINVAHPVRYSFCGADGAVCKAQAIIPWNQIRAAAEEFYDRTDTCRFTSFVAYEWSGNPNSDMVHRNVIFRNERVPGYPVSFVDDPRPEGLWDKLRSGCLERGDGCDVLAIPHNSNLSGGVLFRVESSDGAPLTAAAARERAAIEPLVEILQHKGDSECRVAGAGEDELCGFEKLPFAKMAQQTFPFLWGPAPPLSYVREVLGEGLVQQQKLGANPFKLGIIASSDTHMGTAGLVDEDQFLGHAAGGDTAHLDLPATPDAIEFNPGGLAVVWAEENSRDALFDAMRRRETYGTSGPRMIVRFFGGWNFPDDLCADTALVERGYREGVPMGGDLPPRTSEAPRFVVWALADAGTEEHPGTPLQRAQIVKVWLENGQVKEKVYEVAGNPKNGATVDTRTCERQGDGFAHLCTVWRDPAFDPRQQALYYSRVVDNPSCRWSAYVCNAAHVDCGVPSTVPTELAGCCEPSYLKAVQERAWTSPIWWTPEGT